MHRVRSRWRFGAPEILLLLAALAVVAPLTAWWHAFCQPREVAIGRTEPVATGFASLDVSPDAEGFTVVGYIMPGRTAFSGVPNPAVSYIQPGQPDTNLLLLFGVAMIGIVVSAIYAFGVYPELRRVPRSSWV